MESILVRAYDDRFGQSNSRWVLVSRNQEWMRQLSALAGSGSAPSQQREVVLWTDDYSSIFHLLE